MKSRIQLQIIKKIGLVVYYDNPDYYNFSLDKQRKLLLKELIKTSNPKDENLFYLKYINLMNEFEEISF